MDVCHSQRTRLSPYASTCSTNYHASPRQSVAFFHIESVCSQQKHGPTNSQYFSSPKSVSRPSSGVEMCSKRNRHRYVRPVKMNLITQSFCGVDLAHVATSFGLSSDAQGHTCRVPERRGRCFRQIILHLQCLVDMWIAMLRPFPDTLYRL